MGWLYDAAKHRRSLVHSWFSTFSEILFISDQLLFRLSLSNIIKSYLKRSRYFKVPIVWSDGIYHTIVKSPFTSDQLLHPRAKDILRYGRTEKGNWGLVAFRNKSHSYSSFIVDVINGSSRPFHIVSRYSVIF